jgi:hypothetical protein
LRPQFQSKLDGFFAAARFPHNGHIGFVLEHTAEPATHEAVIIDQQN